RGDPLRTGEGRFPLIAPRSVSEGSLIALADVLVSPREQRIRRAEELTAQYPYAAEPLRFYQQLVRFQEGMQESLRATLTHFGRPQNEDVFPLRALLREEHRDLLLPRFPEFLDHVRRTGSPALAHAATEWRFKRVRCVACGEEEFERLVFLTTEEFPHVRINACDTCHTYFKEVDLVKELAAVPVVDENATMPLDVVAVERGYRKLELNLIGM